MSTGFAFAVTFIIFLAGMYLFGFAFTLTQWQAPVFVGGILLVSVALAIPFHVLKRTD